jgi:NAD+ synthase
MDKVLMDKVSVVIGRFQPFHLGHAKMIETALQKTYKVIVIVGSSNKQNTKENPCAVKTRIEMIRNWLRLKGVEDRVEIKTLKDRKHYSEIGYGDYIIKKCKLNPNKTIFIMGDDSVRESWFSAKLKDKLEFIKLDRESLSISGTMVRDYLITTYDGLYGLYQYIPQGVSLEPYRIFRERLLEVTLEERFGARDLVDKDTIFKLLVFVRINVPQNTKAIIGISGGKDSTVNATLIQRALPKGSLIGVRMPQGEQHDLDVAQKVCELLDIESYEVNIKSTCDSLKRVIKTSLGKDPLKYPVYKSNTPARIRMTTLYGIAAMLGGRVVNTCNRSEDYVGYSTKWGDSVGDFSPLSDFTATEVIDIGIKLGIPGGFLFKKPEDGLSGKTDEDNMGFTYKELDNYILFHKKPEHLEKIESMHKAGLHKLSMPPRFKKGE